MNSLCWTTSREGTYHIRAAFLRVNMNVYYDLVYRNLVYRNILYRVILKISRYR